MIKITDKTMCSGCHACYNVCPVHCIKMLRDEEGFLYPEVDIDRCIQCARCEDVCQALNPLKSSDVPIAYGCYNKDEETLNVSSSGGVFSLLAQYIIEQGGTVFGAAFMEDNTVRHIGIQRKEDISQLRGSKYVQSIIGDTYHEARELLRQNRLVFFTGTPCQIDGLLHYLGKSYDNLYTQDIICHGVPSPMVWKKYMEYREQEASSPIENISFRSKRYGWRSFSMDISFSNKAEYSMSASRDLYMQGFLHDLYLRPSCYHCHSKTESRNADISLADFWGVEKVLPDWYNQMGTSLVLLHTEKGKHLFSVICNYMSYKQVEFCAAAKYNSAISKSVQCPDLRKKTIEEIQTKGFSDGYREILREVSKVPLIRKVKNRIISTFKSR